MQNKNLSIQDIKKHIREREYMSGILRDKVRIKMTQEVFTPTPLARKIVQKIPIDLFKDPNKTFIDFSAGDGQLLGEVLIRKLENGINFKTALSTIYGVERLLCGQENLRHIVEKNIVCHDALTYDYSFNGSNNTEAELRFNNLFELK